MLKTLLKLLKYRLDIRFLDDVETKKKHVEKQLIQYGKSDNQHFTVDC